ncbi:hypothetical protein NDU88_000912 [Pleurodeles waltl]|uniref:Uncharacterized protein n=1 Tax=Pleurodeles waltl TaxID=8319 RepID=A0AAV7N9J0_PLEWA|nr:hypothetical protein NDU88_000912 [Pleurodeles waltl]
MSARAPVCQKHHPGPEPVSRVRSLQAPQQGMRGGDNRGTFVPKSRAPALRSDISLAVLGTSVEGRPGLLCGPKMQWERKEDPGVPGDLK